MGAEVIIPLLLTAASAGTSYINTRNTAKAQDNQAATAIRNQSAKQRAADAKVNAEVSKLQGSSSADEKAKRMADYSAQLRRNKAVQSGGLAPAIGSQTFRDDAAAASDQVQSEGMATADLMARMDAPGMQRQGEAFGFGHLGTDIDMVRRESQGQSFIDDLRLRAIRRNPWLDLASGVMSGAAGAFGGGSTGSMFGKPAVSQVSIPQIPRFSIGG